MRPIFITGTDTGVGKSHVAVGLLGALRAHGLHPFAIKPIETGCDDLAAPEDGLRLARALGRLDALDAVCPLRFTLPAAPMTAAAREGTSLDPDTVLRAVEAAAAMGDPLVIEGAGGLLVPITEDFSFAEVARAVGARLVVVARDALGTINHTRMTLLAAEKYGLTVCAVVLNQPSPTPDSATLDHAATLARLVRAPVLGPMLHGADAAAEVVRVGLLARVLAADETRA